MCKSSSLLPCFSLGPITLARASTRRTGYILPPYSCTSVQIQYLYGKVGAYRLPPTYTLSHTLPSLRASRRTSPQDTTSARQSAVMRASLVTWSWKWGDRVAGTWVLKPDVLSHNQKLSSFLTILPSLHVSFWVFPNISEALCSASIIFASAMSDLLLIPSTDFLIRHCSLHLQKFDF